MIRNIFCLLNVYVYYVLGFIWVCYRVCLEKDGFWKFYFKDVNSLSKLKNLFILILLLRKECII